MQLFQYYRFPDVQNLIIVKALMCVDRRIKINDNNLISPYKIIVRSEQNTLFLQIQFFSVTSVSVINFDSNTGST